MNDPTSAEREALTTRLRTAVPSEPDLWGLAARAESGARRNRTRRRTGVAAVGVGVAAWGVTAVVVAPQLLGSHAHQQSFRSPPNGVPAHPCSGTPDHGDFTKGQAVWAIFCATKPSRGDVSVPPVPHHVLTKGVTGLVAAWQRGSGAIHSCPLQTGVTHFTVRVGFADGTTTTIRGETGACQTALTPSVGSVAGPEGARVYDDLVQALARQAGGGGHPDDSSAGPSSTASGGSPSSDPVPSGPPTATATPVSPVSTPFDATP
jgi:hypothetical protein